MGLAITAEQRKGSGAVQTSGGNYVAWDKIAQGGEIHGDKVMGDKITTGNIQGVGIAIGQGASVQIYGDVHYYPIKLRAPLRKAFDPLIEDRRKLFGGREAAFTRIGDFIQTPAGGYLVVTAPAGFGKTALMANLVGSTPQAFAYHFFTPLYRDSLSEDFFLRNVVEQMAEWHGHTEQLPDKTAELRALYQRFLTEPLEHTQVLVLDGLDEVTTWKLAPYLSRRLPRNLHLILTVRDVGQDWASDYSLPADQTSHLPLGGLTRDDVARVLRAAGPGAVVFAEDPKLVDEVMRVSAYQVDETFGADPFYVRLLAEDAADGSLTPENVVEQPKGLNAYLDKWWQEIKQMAGDTSARDLFGTLTVALGWITRTDLEAVNPSLVDAWAADFFDEVIRKVRRFVAHDESQGYAIAHPRLRQHMRTRIKTDAYREKLLAYCADWQKHYSAYALNYYARYLAEAGEKDKLYELITKEWMDAKFERTYSHRAFAQDVDLAIEAAAADESPEGLVQLVRAYLIYASLGELAGQLPAECLGVLVQNGQVARACSHAELMQEPNVQCKAWRIIAEILESQGNREVGIRALRQALRAVSAIDWEGGGRTGLLEELQYALVRLGEKETFRQDLILAAVNLDSLSVVARIFGHLGDRAGLDQALVLAEQHEDSLHKTFALSSIAVGMAQVGDKQSAVETANRALSVKLDFKEWSISATADAFVHADYIDQPLAEAERIEDDMFRAEALTAFALAMAHVGKKNSASAIADKAIAAARIIKDHSEREKELVHVVKTLIEVGQIDKMWTVAKEIEDRSRRVDALIDVAHAAIRGGDNGFAIRIAEEALEETEAIDSRSEKDEALRRVGEVFGLAGKVDRTLGISERIHSAEERATILSMAAEAIFSAAHPSEARAVARRALQAVKETPEVTSSDTFGRIARVLSQMGDKDGLRQIIAVADAIVENESRVEVLGQVVEAARQSGEREIALELTDRLMMPKARRGGDRDKVDALTKIAEALAQVGIPGEVSENIAISPNDEAKRADITHSGMGLSTPGDMSGAAEVARNAIENAKMIEDNDERSRVFFGLADALSLARNSRIAIEAIKLGLECAGRSEEWDPTWFDQGGEVLVRLGGVNLALSVIEGIGNERIKPLILGGIASALGHCRDEKALQRTLAIARTIPEARLRTYALGRLAVAFAEGGSEMSTEVAEEAWQAALETTDWMRPEELIWVAAPLARVGDLEKALTVAQSIEDLRAKAWMLCAIANALVQAKNSKGLLQVLAVVQAIEKERLQKQQYVYSVRTNAVLEVALHLAAIGDKDNFQQALADLGAERTYEPGIARAFALAGDSEQALAAAEAITDLETRTEAICEVARALAKVGDTEGAARAAKLALTKAGLADDVFYRGRVIPDIGHALILANEFDLAEKVAAEIRNDWNKTLHLSSLSAVLMKAGQHRHALDVLRKAFVTARHTGREGVFQVLESGSLTLAAIDQGDTLWKVYKTLKEVDSWWR